MTEVVIERCKTVQMRALNDLIEAGEIESWFYEKIVWDDGSRFAFDVFKVMQNREADEPIIVGVG